MTDGKFEGQMGHAGVRPFTPVFWIRGTWVSAVDGQAVSDQSACVPIDPGVMTVECDKLRSVSVGRVTDKFMELAPASAYERQARADGAMAERAHIVAWLRARKCGIANDDWDKTLDQLADEIERGEHAKDAYEAGKRADGQR